MTDALMQMIGANERYIDIVQSIKVEKSEPQMSPEEVVAHVLQQIKGG